MLYKDMITMINLKKVLDKMINDQSILVVRMITDDTIESAMYNKVTYTRDDIFTNFNDHGVIREDSNLYKVWRSVGDWLLMYDSIFSKTTIDNEIDFNGTYGNWLLEKRSYYIGIQKIIEKEAYDVNNYITYLLQEQERLNTLKQQNNDYIRFVALKNSNSETIPILNKLLMANGVIK